MNNYTDDEKSRIRENEMLRFKGYLLLKGCVSGRYRFANTFVPGKFVILDTKISHERRLTSPNAPITKEECAKEGKAIRGRQVLFMFD